MEKFKFNGEWEFEMELSELIKSNSNWSNSLGQKKKNKAISIKIRDFRSYDPDPLKEQENTLNYLMNNQSKVIDALCKAMDTINDDYGERTGMRKRLPAKMNPQNLGEVLLINEILILTDHKEHQAYYGYTCEYKEDLEHGLIIVMHGNELIDYSAIGEMGWYGIPLEFEEFGKNQIQQVLPKYGKFKPWQLEATREYLDHLLWKEEHETLIKIIDNNEWDYNYKFADDDRSLIDFAIQRQNLEIVKHLIGKGADFSKSYIGYTGKKDVVRLIVKNGGNIDNFAVNGKTPFANEVLNFGWVMLRLTSTSKMDSVNYNEALNHVKEAEDRLSFYLEMGANPNNCDGKGGDYKSMIGGRWKNNIELSEKIFGTLKEMISKY